MSTAYDNTILATAGLTHYWPCNEAVGNGTINDVFAGTPVNSTLLANITQGAAGGCVDGSFAATFTASGLATFGSNPLPASGVFTIEFAVNISSPAGFVRFITDTAHACQVFIQNGNIGWGMSSGYVGSAFPTGAWKYVTIVGGGGGGITCYINGASVGTASGQNYTSSGVMFFGDSGNSFVGSIQKIAFYNTNLSSGTVSAHYTAFTTNPNDILLATGAQIAVSAGDAKLQIDTPLLAQGAQIAVTPGNAQLNINTPLLATGAQVAVTPGNANMVINNPFLASGAQIVVTPGKAMFTIGGGVLDTGGIDIMGDSQTIAYGILGDQD